jgi:phage-related minor tail protein
MASTIATLRALLALDNKDYLDGLTNTQTVTNNFGTKLSNIGGAVVVGGLAVAAGAITAVGTAAWEAGNTVDAAMDSIVTKTGATGPKLLDLRKDFDAVFSSVPTDAATAADAIGILNSKLDITGPALQDLAKPLLEMTRITGGDLTTNAQTFTQVIGAWKIPVDQAAGSLDKLFVASQKSGAPIETLLGDMSTIGPTMQAFGLSFDTSAALMANWEAKGVNAEKMIAGLKIAAGKFSNENIPMKKGLWDTVKAIQGATNETDAMNIAMKVFGAKGAVDMVDAIRSGRFNIDDLTSAMLNADGAILTTAKDTTDWGEKWKVFQNKMTVALAPLGQKMMDAVGGALDKLGALFDRPDIQAAFTGFANFAVQAIGTVVTYIPVLIDSFFQFVTFLQNNQGIVIGILAALGTAIVVWAYTTIAAAVPAAVALVTALWPALLVMTLVGAAAYLLYQAWVNNWGGIQEKTAAVWAFLQPIFENVKTWLQTNIPIAIQALTDFWTGKLWPAMQAVWNWMSANLFPLLSAIGNLVGIVLVADFAAWSLIWETRLKPALSGLWSFLQTYVWPILQTVGNYIGGRLSVAFQSLTIIINGITSAIKWMSQALSGIKVPAYLTPHSPTPFEMGLRGIGDAMQSLTRSQLPTFQAALQLNPEPVLSSASLALQPQPMSVSTEMGAAAGAQQASSDALLKDVQRMLRELPDTIAKVSRNSTLRTST